MYIYCIYNFYIIQYITMMPMNEALHPDSSDYCYSWNENLVKKTNTEISKVFDEEVKMSSASSIIKKVQELNPGVAMETDLDRGIIYASVNVEELNLPKWFYYNQKNGITNKHNTQSGIYGSVHVYPIEYRDLYAVYYN